MDNVVEKWKSGLAEKTWRKALPILMDYFKFLGRSPEETIAWQKMNPNDYTHVDVIYKWLDNGRLSVSTKQLREGIIRGFHKANRAPMPAEKHRYHSDRTPVKGNLEVDEFRKILLSCNLKYRALFLVQFQSGSGIGELMYINRHHAEYVFDEVKHGREMIRLTMPGRKGNKNVKPYYTFLGKDAVEALRHYFYSEGWKRDEVLFRTEQGGPMTPASVTLYFKSHAIKTGVINRVTWSCLECGGETVRKEKQRSWVRKIVYVCTVCQREFSAKDFNLNRKVTGGIRYRVRPHELRDLFKTQSHYAQTYGNFDGSCAEFFMGHTIDKLEYDKIMRDTKYAASEYRKLMPFINVLSEEPLKLDRASVDLELETLRKELSEMAMLKSEVAVLKNETIPKLLENVKRMMEQQK